MPGGRASEDSQTEEQTEPGSAEAAMPSPEAARPAESSNDPKPGQDPDPATHEPDKPQLVKHRVVSRETVRQIAARYGVLQSALRRWNDLPDDLERPKPRSTLKVWAKRIPPARVRVEHVVVEGDTWGQIARRYGAASTDIRAYNVSRIGRSLDPEEVVHVWVDPVVRADIERADEADLLRRGAYGVGSPADGRLVNGVQILEGPDWTLHFPSSAWGTTFAVNALMSALHQWRASSGFSGVLRIGSMSRQRGGEFGSHRSHQTGRDVDIRLPLRVDTPQGIPVNVRRVDWIALWHLVDTFERSGSVEVIFFDYKLQRRLAKAAAEAGVPEERIAELLQWPIGSKASRGAVRHEPGHTEHIHVRFACGPYETECAER
jgi:murein endopeptidase/LysM repeat protein